MWPKVTRNVAAYKIKRNISDIAAPSGLFAKFLAVNPKKYQFKPEAFRSLSLSAYVDTCTTAGKLATQTLAQYRLATYNAYKAAVAADSLKALDLAKRWQIGFLAEEFNGISSKVGNEIDQSEVTAVLWLTLQEAIKEAALLKQRIATFEAQAATFETRLKALEAK